MVRDIRVRLYTYGYQQTHVQNTHKHVYSVEHSTQECVGSTLVLTKGSDGCRINGEPSVNVFFCFFWLWYGPVESDSLH